MELVTGLESPLSQSALPVGNTHCRGVLLCMNIKQISGGKQPVHFTAPHLKLRQQFSQSNRCFSRSLVLVVT